MAIKRWNEFEVSNFRGIASSNRHPQKNECQECKNFDTRYIDGDLTLRPGFTQKYTAPASADYRGKLSSISWLAFQNFYIPEGGGQEVTIWVAKATLAGETAIVNSTPANRNIIALFSSHQYINGAWDDKNYDGITDGKYWLNHTVATNVYSSSTTNEVKLDFSGTTVLTGSIDTTASANVTGVGTLFTTELKVGDRILVGGEVRVVATITSNTALTVTSAFSDLANDTSPEKLLNFDGWSIVNITKSPDEVAQVIETYIHTGSLLGVKITNNAHSWAADDVLILMRNYIPYDSLIAMYSCTADDITFHKVLNDLRIGFGGQASRIGLSIGYRKSYLKLNEITFGTFSSLYESLSTVNNIILDTYIPTGLDQYKLKTIIAPGLSGDELPIGTYFARMTAVLDGFNEVLVSENRIVLEEAADLFLIPQVKLGILHKRIISLKIYIATTDAITNLTPTNPYYFAKEFIVRTTDSYTPELWKVNKDGYMELSTYDLFTELYNGNNAAEIGAGEVDATTGFTITDSCNLAVAGTGKTDTSAASDGSYWLKFLNNTGSAVNYEGYYYQAGLFVKNNRYTVTFNAKGSVVTVDERMILSVVIEFSSSQAVAFHYPLTTVWNEFTFEFTAPLNCEIIHFRPSAATADGKIVNNGYFGLDGISIKNQNQASFNSIDVNTDNEEMSDALGYQPTFDLIKSWDQTIVTQGRAFFVNPYIEKRYENKIFRSHISGAGAFMYDVASAGEYIDLENFDGNSLVGIEVLPNLDFIALKTNGSQRVDPNTGATREISFSSGCNSRRSIVNFGDKVVWCSDHDIHASDGLNTVSIADKTIREEYRTLITGLSGNKIFATRETKDNAYRFLMNAPALEKEYILTKKGWVTRVNANSLVPDYYSTSQDGTVWLMDAGIIYFDSTGISLDNVTTMTASWKSVEMDCELIGEGLTERDFILLSSVWADFTVASNALYTIDVVLKIYIDNSLYKTFTHNVVGTTNAGRKKFFNQFFPKNGKRFYIEVSVSGAGVFGKSVQLHSVGVLWQPTKAGFFN